MAEHSPLLALLQALQRWLTQLYSTIRMALLPPPHAHTDTDTNFEIEWKTETAQLADANGDEIMLQGGSESSMPSLDSIMSAAVEGATAASISSAIPSAAAAAAAAAVSDNDSATLPPIDCFSHFTTDSSMISHSLGDLHQQLYDHLDRTLRHSVHQISVSITELIDADMRRSLLAIACCILSTLFIWFLWYRCCGVRHPRLYTQHLGAEHATQLPPPDAQRLLESSDDPALNAVRDTVTDSESSFRRWMDRLYAPSPFLAVPFGLGGHLQTFFTALANSAWLGTPYVNYTREHLLVKASRHELQDGIVALDWAMSGLKRAGRGRGGLGGWLCPGGEAHEVEEWHQQFTQATPTVIICHGLAGGSMEHYVKALIFHLSHHYGWRCVVFNARGCGGTKLASGQLFCGAYTDDLRQVVTSIRRRLPLSPLIGVGFSLGANILTKYTGEEGLACGKPPFAAMVAVANPFDFLHSSRTLDANWIMRRVYSRNLAANLVKLLKTHLYEEETKDTKRARRRNQTSHKSTPNKDVHQSKKYEEAQSGDEPLIHADDDRGEESESETTNIAAAASSSSSVVCRSLAKVCDLPEVFAAPTLREFDKRLTRRVFHYATVNDYYRDASSSRFVKFITVPTLFLNALDDPISHHEGIPYDECCINPFVTLVTTHAGGHSMDWFSGGGSGGALKSWSALSTGTFVAEILARTDAYTHGAKTTCTTTATKENEHDCGVSVQHQRECVCGIDPYAHYVSSFVATPPPYLHTQDDADDAEYGEDEAEAEVEADDQSQLVQEQEINGVIDDGDDDGRTIGAGVESASPHSHSISYTHSPAVVHSFSHSSNDSSFPPFSPSHSPSHSHSQSHSYSLSPSLHSPSAALSTSSLSSPSTGSRSHMHTPLLNGLPIHTPATPLPDSYSSSSPFPFHAIQARTPSNAFQHYPSSPGHIHETHDEDEDEASLGSESVADHDVSMMQESSQLNASIHAALELQQKIEEMEAALQQESER